MFEVNTIEGDKVVIARLMGVPGRPVAETLVEIKELEVEQVQPFL